MFSVEQVDQRFQQCLNVVAAVVAELDEEVKQTQHLSQQQ